MNTLFSPLQEFWKKGDKLLLLLCLLASAYGVALIYSATRYNENDRRTLTLRSAPLPSTNPTSG